MARSLACHSSCRNPPFISKDEPASHACTKSSDTYIFAPALSRAPTPAWPAALAPASALAPAAVDSTVRYSEAGLQ